MLVEPPLIKQSERLGKEYQHATNTPPFTHARTDSSDSINMQPGIESNKGMVVNENNGLPPLSKEVLSVLLFKVINKKFVQVPK